MKKEIQFYDNNNNVIFPVITGANSINTIPMTAITLPFGATQSFSHANGTWYWTYFVIGSIQFGVMSAYLNKRYTDRWSGSDTEFKVTYPISMNDVRLGQVYPTDNGRAGSFAKYQYFSPTDADWWLDGGIDSCAFNLSFIGWRSV